MQKIRKQLTADEAYRKLSNRCALTECAPQDMLRKLQEWQLPPQDAASVMERLYSRQFLDDRRYARAFVHDKFNYAGWGKIKIGHGLALKGIPQQIAAEALDEIPEKLYRESLLRLLKQKRQATRAASTYELRAKLVRFALGRGFEQGLTMDLLAQMGAGADD